MKDGGFTGKERADDERDFVHGEEGGDVGMVMMGRKCDVVECQFDRTPHRYDLLLKSRRSWDCGVDVAMEMRETIFGEHDELGNAHPHVGLCDKTHPKDRPHVLGKKHVLPDEPNQNPWTNIPIMTNPNADVMPYTALTSPQLCSTDEKLHLREDVRELG